MIVEARAVGVPRRRRGVRQAPSSSCVRKAPRSRAELREEAARPPSAAAIGTAGRERRTRSAERLRIPPGGMPLPRAPRARALIACTVPGRTALAADTLRAGGAGAGRRRQVRTSCHRAGSPRQRCGGPAGKARGAGTQKPAGAVPFDRGAYLRDLSGPCKSEAGNGRPRLASRPSRDRRDGRLSRRAAEPGSDRHRRGRHQPDQRR